MSFGCSPSDIVALVTITSKAYRGWKNACGEYSEITGSLDSFLILLERIETEASKRNSVLRPTVSDQEDLKDILSNSESTVRELHAIVVRYKSLGSSREKNWDKLRLGVKSIGPLWEKLTQHTVAITGYLEAVGLGALGRIERDLNNIPERIQHNIDALAAGIRAGRRENSIMTTYSDDEKDVWRQFRRELIGDGMKSKIVHEYKPLIRKYLKELSERGELEEQPPEEERQAEDMERVSAASEPQDYQPSKHILRPMSKDIRTRDYDRRASAYFWDRMNAQACPKFNQRSDPAQKDNDKREELNVPAVAADIVGDPAVIVDTHSACGMYKTTTVPENVDQPQNVRSRQIECGFDANALSAENEKPSNVRVRFPVGWQRVCGATMERITSGRVYFAEASTQYPRCDSGEIANADNSSIPGETDGRKIALSTLLHRPLRPTFKKRRPSSSSSRHSPETSEGISSTDESEETSYVKSRENPPTLSSNPQRQMTPQRAEQRSGEDLATMRDHPSDVESDYSYESWRRREVRRSRSVSRESNARGSYHRSQNSEDDKAYLARRRRNNRIALAGIAAAGSYYE